MDTDDYGLFLFIVINLTACVGQREPALPVSADSFKQILRTVIPVPEGRKAKLSDINIIHYGNGTEPRTYRISDVARLLSDPHFDAERPTILYIHGYVELWTDPSVQRVARAYRRRGGSNLLVLDWANLGFGNYLAVALSADPVGRETGKALWRLLTGGLPLRGLHIVGHSMGAIIAGVTGRYLAGKGFKVPRITGLDPAYPGFYPPLLSTPLNPGDAAFVDVVHTDGGGFGAPASTGHADFWPNAGTAKQPGCPPLTLPLTVEDFCSHWRSWQYWAEAVAGAQFLARRCADYDAFLRGRCRGAPQPMGPAADAALRGNFYLRTAAQEPFALGERGAE